MTRSHLTRILFSLTGLCLTCSFSNAQSRLVLNGGIITIAQGAYVVIDNPNANAITRTTGHIISEGSDNQIKWNISTTTGAYTIPWGYGSTSYIPLTFTKTAGVGAGYFLFSTYHTTPDNAQLPPGVTNVDDANAVDNSLFVSDRFWQINAQSYTTKPTLTDLAFTYLDAENTAPNTIVEEYLKVKRYNSSLDSWTDNILVSTVNTTTNIVTVALVDEANLEAWWMLGAMSPNRYWVAPTNSTTNLSANWSETSGGLGNAGVPTIENAVFFDGAGDFNCSIDAALSALSISVEPDYTGVITQGSHAITVNTDATFSGGSFVGGAANLTVNGNLTISGTAFSAPTQSIFAGGDFSVTGGAFSHNNGTIIFAGTGATQNITSTSATTFNNISLANTATPGVAVQSDQNLAGTLTLAENTNFDADGTGNTAVFRLLSAGDDPTLDASVGILPTGALVSGRVTVQRFMTEEGLNNGRIYRYISSPVQNAPVSDIQQEIPVTGTFTGRSTCTGCVSAAQSMFSYNETVITDSDASGSHTEHDGYVDYPNAANSEVFQPARGYAIFVRANIIPSAMWDLRGVINRGNDAPVIFPVTYTSSGQLPYDGWNLVGNPFPSTIDWDASSGWTKSNLDAAVYVTNNDGPGLIYATYIGGIGVNGGSRYIATGQGFWVKASGAGAPALQADENIKAAGVQTTFFREAAPDNLIRITMVGGAVRDETVIHFRDDGTDNFDSQADALKLTNSTFNLSTLQPDGKSLAINAIAPLACLKEISLNVENAVAGNYRLNFSEYESFDENIVISLLDKLNGKNTNIRTISGYDFSVSADPASYGKSRFQVTFGLPTLNPELQLSVTNVCPGGEAIITINNTQRGVTYTPSSVTNPFLAAVTGNGSTMTFSVPASVLPGDEIMNITSSWAGCSAEVEANITIHLSPTIEAISASGGIICIEGSTLLRASGAPAGGSYNWYESETSNPITGQHADSVRTKLLLKSTTYFVAVVNEFGCEGSKKPVVAHVSKFDEAQITLSSTGDALLSNYPDHNQWFFNDKKVAQGTGPSIIPDRPGTYMLQVLIGACVTSAAYDFRITGVEDEEQYYFSIFPNPVLKDFTLTVPKSFRVINEIELINGAGQTVWIQEAIDTNERVFYIDMSTLPTGVYVLRISGSVGIHEQKVMKR